MINNVTLTGRLVKDIDLAYTANGVAVGSFRMAVNRNFTNSSGNTEADFINCVVWRKQAETMANYLRQGSLVGIVGRLQSRSYENKSGQRVYVTEVLIDHFTFLESKSSSNNQTDQKQEVQGNSNTQSSVSQTSLYGPGISQSQDFGREINMNDDRFPY